MTASELAETINRAHDELSQIVPQSDLALPGGQRSRAAAYVHQHMKMLAGGLEGYGFEDSAIGEGQKKVANLSEGDRFSWIGSAHDSAAEGAKWVTPHLSRTTNEYFSDRALCEQALVYLPAPEVTTSSREDKEVIGVIVNREDRRYIVPMGNPETGEVHEARPLAGLGAGLVNAQNMDQALVGLKPEDLVEAHCTMRPMNNSNNGPVMIVGMSWQTSASERSSQLAQNAVERFEILHEYGKNNDSIINIAFQSGIMTQDKMRQEAVHQSKWMDTGQGEYDRGGMGF